jgi:cytochrome d ubiquinol oxidase subunit I
MSVEILSRIQFASVVMFHFLFVPLTLGLSAIVAFMETRYAMTGEAIYLKMTRYWSKLFLVNFAIGVVTGITLEFQFGMNWAQYSKFVGDIFGAPLAIEATVAFFLESTFIGLWMFSWNRVSKGVHAAIMWVVAGASSLSALWILLANGWMQKPRGYIIAAGRAQLVDFGALVWNPYAWIKLFHSLSAAFTVAAFFVMGISAINILAGRRLEVSNRSFRMAAPLGLVASILIIVAGDLSAVQVANFQPTKLAAMESVWKTEAGAPFYLLQLPNPSGEGNLIQALPVPKALSLLAYHDPNATVKGLEEFAPADRPPVMTSYLSFRLMVGLGFLFVLLAFLAVLFSRKRVPAMRPWFLRLMTVAIALPYIACELGWMLAEFGRQPWIVYGILRTRDAYSTNITTTDVLISLVGFLIVYTALAAVDVFLLAKYARKDED